MNARTGLQAGAATACVAPARTIASVPARIRVQRPWGEEKKLANIKSPRSEETALGPREPDGATVAGPAGGRLEQFVAAFKAALHKSPLTIRHSRGLGASDTFSVIPAERERGPESITTILSVSRGLGLSIPGSPLCPRPGMTERTMPNKIDLAGRFAVVTGGAQGIGRAITERFLDSGAAVAIWDRDKAFAEKTAAELGNRGKTIAVACDVHRPGRRGARTRRYPQGLRPHRHPGQQRRHRGQERHHLGLSDRGMGAGDAHQSRRPVPLLPRDGARHDRARLRPHRQHRLGRRQGRQPECVGLLGVESRRDRADQIARQGARRLRYRGELPSRRPPRKPRSSTR